MKNILTLALFAALTSLGLTSTPALAGYGAWGNLAYPKTCIIVLRNGVRTLVCH